MPAETPFTIRLPQELADALRKRAAAEHRSLNKEVIFLLERVLFPTADADAYGDTRRRLAEMPRYTVNRPFNRRPRPGDGNG